MRIYKNGLFTVEMEKMFELVWLQTVVQTRFADCAMSEKFNQYVLLKLHNKKHQNKNSEQKSELPVG